MNSLQHHNQQIKLLQTKINKKSEQKKKQTTKKKNKQKKKKKTPVFSSHPQFLSPNHIYPTSSTIRVDIGLGPAEHHRKPALCKNCLCGPFMFH